MSVHLAPPALSRRSYPPDPAEVVGLAHFFSPRSIMEPHDLYASADALFTLLQEKKIPHVLVEGLAMLFHTEARNTEDVDLIVALGDMPSLPGLKIEERNEWFAKASCGPLRVDLLFTENPLFALVAARHSAPRNFRSHTLQVATPEGLLLLKLFALPSLYRQGQAARAALYESDIAQLLVAETTEDKTLLDTLRPHLMESDINALAGVLSDVRKQLARRF